VGIFSPFFFLLKTAAALPLVKIVLNKKRKKEKIELSFFVCPTLVCTHKELDSIDKLFAERKFWNILEKSQKISKILEKTRKIFLF
jgi:hypothetical protein